MAELVRYDAMCRAIDAAYEVDEVKDIRDKALAIEVYTRQAHNTEAERRACEIRLRAERKVGQLLKAAEKAKGGGDRRSDHRSNGATGGRKTLADLGISKDQSSKWQQLAGWPAWLSCPVGKMRRAAPGDGAGGRFLYLRKLRRCAVPPRVTVRVAGLAIWATGPDAQCWS